jgi:hypothetical protein
VVAPVDECPLHETTSPDGIAASIDRCRSIRLRLAGLKVGYLQRGRLTILSEDEQRNHRSSIHA